MRIRKQHRFDLPDNRTLLIRGKTIRLHEKGKGHEPAIPASPQQVELIQQITFTVGMHAQKRTRRQS